MLLAIALPCVVASSLMEDYSYPWCTLVIDVFATGFYFHGDKIYLFSNCGRSQTLLGADHNVLKR